MRQGCQEYSSSFSGTLSHNPNISVAMCCVHWRCYWWLALYLIDKSGLQLRREQELMYWSLDLFVASLWMAQSIIRTVNVSLFMRTKREIGVLWHITSWGLFNAKSLYIYIYIYIYICVCVCVCVCVCAWVCVCVCVCAYITWCLTLGFMLYAFGPIG